MNHSKHKYDSYWEKDGKKIIDCQTCGFKHFLPIPTKQELEEFYSYHYYDSVKPFDYNLVDKSSIEDTIKKVIRTSAYINIYNKVDELLQYQDSARSLKMIDVGCGNKLLTKYFQLKQWDVAAIELSKNASAYLGQFDIKVYTDSVDELNQLPDNKLAFINIEFVLEHLRKPLHFLKMAHQALVPGGILRICVPNDFSEGQLAYEEKYGLSCPWSVYPDHINYFTFESLSQLLNQHGFKEVYRTTNFPLEFLVAGGINYYANEEDKNKVSPFVRNFEQTFIQTGRREVLDKLYESLAQLGLGRSIYMYAIKVE